MTERVLGPTGGRRRKRLAIFVPLLAIAALILAIGASGGPVSNAAGFQGDDGNLVKGTSSSGTECEATPVAIDWNCFKALSWSDGTSPYRQADKVSLGWEVKGIEDAQEVTSDTSFAGGTKQDNDCATVNTGEGAEQGRSQAHLCRKFGGRAGDDVPGIGMGSHSAEHDLGLGPRRLRVQPGQYAMCGHGT